eukprot:32361-Eustigmatos_ZCMA.PRE.1
MACCLGVRLPAGGPRLVCTCPRPEAPIHHIPAASCDSEVLSTLPSALACCDGALVRSTVRSSVTRLNKTSAASASMCMPADAR